MPQVNQLLVEVNRRAYSLPAIVRNYALNESLDPPEQRILERYRDRIAGKSVLDLGCGTGRTTAALAALAASYDGVDIAAPMVAHCRARFAHLAHARFHVMDAASLPGFADAAFDFILFSFNGIDCMGHDGRLAVLRESRRRLRADGILAFTTHNRGCAAIQRRPRPPPSLSPRPWASYARNLFNSLRLRRHEIALVHADRVLLAQVEGRSLVPAMRGGPVEARPIFAEHFDGGITAPRFMVRNGRYKLTESSEFPRQIFDIEADPLELDNLAGRHAIATVERDLVNLCRSTWDPDALAREIEASRRRRRFLIEALAAGRHEPWDYAPPSEARQRYVRRSALFPDVERNGYLAYPPSSGA